MKKGRTLTELAQELERQRTASKDYAVPIQQLAMNEEGKIEFTNGARHEFMPTAWADQQIAVYSDIPKNYYDKLKIENPRLLAKNVNHSFDRYSVDSAKTGKQEARMLRTLDNRVRGFLSSRYRRLDCFDLLETVFPVMQDHGLSVESSEITDRRMYVKAVSPRLMTEVKPGDVVQYGIVISSSDVGSGSVRVEPMIHRLVCSNGMIGTSAINTRHLGRNQAGDDVRELLTDETKALSDSAYWAEVRDVVIASMKSEMFEREVDKLRIAANEQIKNPDPLRVVELTMRATGIIGDANRNSIVSALASGNEGAGFTRYGLINSFTRAAQRDEVSYDDSIALERAAGMILELPRTAWSKIASVA